MSTEDPQPISGTVTATPAARAAARRRAAIEAVVASLVVTGAVTAASVGLPKKYVGTAVGFVFLAATWALVWRREDARVRRYGLTLGGLVMPGKIHFGEVARSALIALAWALGLAAIFFIPFYFGWRAWWGASGHFSLDLTLSDALDSGLGQLLVVALPEEAFYRGYLQSRLDEAFPQQMRVNILGARVGPGLLVASVIFALGHVATIHQPARLAVFFPALVFGWLRARTGGIGASLTFHAFCNMFSEALGRGYGMY